MQAVVSLSRATRGRSKSASSEASSEISKSALDRTPEQKKRDLVNAVLGVSAAGFGLGAAGRSFLGWRQLLNARPLALGSGSAIRPDLPIQVPYQEEEEEEKPSWLDSIRGVSKQAEKQDVVGRLAGMLPDSSLITGASDPRSSALGIPLLAGGGIAGLYGGSKLVDWLLKKRRESHLNRALDRSKQEYEDTIKDQYRSSMVAKGAGVSTDIDSLYDCLQDRMEKQAKEPSLYQWATGGLGDDSALQTGVNTAHGLGGAYLTLLGLLTGGTGMAAYQWTKGRGKQHVLEEAMKQRARQRAGPAPIYAASQPVPLQIGQEEEEEDR